MSTEPLFWALKQNPDSQLDKLVLIGVCDQTNSRSDWSALIAMEDLAVFAQASIRRTRDAITRLTEKGFLRSRDTVVVDEAGRRGWKRFYPLIPESPLVRGLLGEIDWDTPEEIESRELRNFLDRTTRAKDHRHNVGKGARRRSEPDSAAAALDLDLDETARSAGTRTESPGTGDPPGTRTESPGTYPDGKSGGTRTESPGTYPDGKSGPSISPPPGVDPLSSVGGVDVDELVRQALERERVIDGWNDDLDEWAFGLVAGADYRGYRRPNRNQAAMLAGLVVAAVVEHGLTRREVKAHFRAALQEVRSAPVTYLRNALHPDHLPVAQPPPERPHRPPAAPPADPDGEPGEPGAGRRAAMEAARNLPRRHASSTTRT